MDKSRERGIGVWQIEGQWIAASCMDGAIEYYCDNEGLEDEDAEYVSAYEIDDLDKEEIVDVDAYNSSGGDEIYLSYRTLINKYFEYGAPENIFPTTIATEDW